MVRSFNPQGVNSSIDTNTNFPPQSRVLEAIPPPGAGSALVQTDLLPLTALVQTDLLPVTALVQTDTG